MKIEQIGSFGAAGRPVRRIVPSPNGEYVVLIYGEGRTWHSSKVQGAALFRREGASFAALGELPVASAKILVQNDGRCAVLMADYQQIELVRCKAVSSKMEVETRTVEMSGMELSEPAFALLPSGRDALIGTTDRDDGQGWSEPVYTDIWRRINLTTGSLVETRGDSFGHSHLLKAPGMPWISIHDGGDSTELNQRIKALPFRREWPRRVGPTTLLTTSRVIHVLTGATLLGKEQTEAGPHRVFHDLSPDEKHVLGADEKEVFELWNVPQQTSVTLDLSSQGGARCAILLAGGEIVVGTGGGKALLLRREQGSGPYD